MATLVLGSGMAWAQAAPDTNSLFNWAERTYPSLFPTGPLNQTFPPYTFRAYSGGHFLAVANAHVFLVGPLTGDSLQDLGPINQYTCFVTPAAAGCAVAHTAQADVELLLNRRDQLWATSVPSAETALSLADACYLDQGRNAAELTTAAATDTQRPVREAHRVGSLSGNTRIISDTTTTNSDGSRRRTLSVVTDISYTDGTQAKEVAHQLISGSSFGTCATPQNDSTWRLLGDQQLAAITIEPRTQRYESFNLSTGARTGSGAQRLFTFNIRDHRHQFTYAVVSGPGPEASASGRSVPFALKLLSPRVQRDDPLFAGKTGNFNNWLDSDTFRICRTDASSAPNAMVADCGRVGARGTGYGTAWTVETPAQGSSTAAVALSMDSSFNALGLGGTYTVALYADDGWKTVNGHANKTPVATYSVTQNRLPYPFASLALGGDLLGKLPSFDGLFNGQAYGGATFNALTAGQSQTFSTSSLKAPIAPDGAKYASRLNWHYFDGPLTDNINGRYYPGSRFNNFTYVASGITQFSRPIDGKPSTLGRIGYMEMAVEYVDRNGHSLSHLKTYSAP